MTRSAARRANRNARSILRVETARGSGRITGGYDQNGAWSEISVREFVTKPRSAFVVADMAEINWPLVAELFNREYWRQMRQIALESAMALLIQREPSRYLSGFAPNEFVARYKNADRS